MERGEEETSNPAPRPGLGRGPWRPPGFLYLLLACTCVELGALIQGLFLPPNGSIDFTQSQPDCVPPTAEDHAGAPVAYGVWCAHKECSA